MNLEVVESPLEAEFILAHGTEALGSAQGTAVPMPLEEMENLLLEASKRPNPPPMIVANPDLVTVEERDLRIMPGKLYSLINCRKF